MDAGLGEATVAELSADVPGLVLADLIRGLDRFAERTAVVEGERKVNYSQLVSDTNRLAWALSSLGLKRGERLAFLLPNGYRILCCYTACATSGLVGVPLGTRLTASDLAHQLRDSDAAGLIFDARWAELVRSIPGELPGLRHMICDGNCGDGVRLGDLLAGAGDARALPNLSGDDVFCVMYTGGTTGASKAAIQTHRAWAACLLDTAGRLRYAHSDRHAVVLPMTHAAWFSLGAHLLVGAETHLMNGWDPSALLALIEREKLTTLHMIPTLLGDLISNPETYSADLSSVRLLTLAGSPVPLELYERARAQFGDIIGNIYGLTEAAGPVTFLLPPDMNAMRLRSGGRPGRYVEVSIVADNGAPTHGLGEIALRGPQITPGYLNRPEETAQAFRNGWFRTGDIGHIDKDGFLYIVDRKKDLIKTGGFNVYPKEVEEILYQHPAVREAAVVGVPDARWMERVVAAVVLDGESAVGVADLLAHCRERLAAYKVPKTVHLETVLPRTAFGKVDKRALKQRYGPEGG